MGQESGCEPQERLFLCTQAAIRPMKRHGGTIINACSFAALIPSVGQAAYAAAKIGVKSLTQVSAAELAPYGIRVLGYLPGVIATQLIQPLIQDPVRAETMRGDIAAHRFGSPAEVASVVAFLASEQAGYVSGCCVEVHGGKLCVKIPAPHINKSLFIRISGAFNSSGYSHF